MNELRSSPSGRGALSAYCAFLSMLLEFASLTTLLGQGTVSVQSDPSNPFYAADCTTRLGSDYWAQLFAGFTADSLAAVGAPVTFRNNASGQGTGIFPSTTTSIPWIPAGGAVFLQVRVWHSASGSSFDEAASNPVGVFGLSTIVFVSSTGGTPLPPATVLIPGNCLTPRSPEIITGITNQVVAAGTNLTLNVLAGGCELFEFQWQYGDADIAGATNSQLLLRNVAETDSGTYTVSVTAVSCNLTIPTNTSATITVLERPTITQQPTHLTNYVTGNTTFSVDAAGTDLVYQWRFGGNDITGANSNALTLENLEEDDAGSYSVVVTNPVGSVESSEAELTVLSAVGFSTNAYTVRENEGHISVPVLRLGSGTGRVNYSTVHGSAWAGRDFDSTQGSLQFESTSEAIIQILIKDNYIPDGPRTFQVQLSQPTDRLTLVPDRQTTTITIEDNEDAGSVFGSLPSIVLPAPRTIHGSSLHVYLLPVQADGRWRLSWETLWRTSGSSISNLDHGNYPIEFKPVPHYSEPPISTNAIPTNTNIHVSFSYLTNMSQTSGSLRVNITEQAGLEKQSVGWRLHGEEHYRLGSTVATNLVSGNHIVEFKHVREWVAPIARSVEIQAELESVITVSYLLWPHMQVSKEPDPLATYEDILKEYNWTPRRPTALAGQLRTVAGWASGIAVQERVVLTAAHILFDEATGEFVSEVEWFHQRHAGEYDPPPLRARGWYVFTNYMSARTLERENGLLPGQSTPTSQQWDVAALYFDKPVAREGYSGYLVSEPSSSVDVIFGGQQFLIGYPLTGHDGKLHVLTVQGNYGKVDNIDVLYQSDSFKSFPGNSGGPLCVEFGPLNERSVYYPAAVYLGSYGNRSLVRIIDADVVDLILRAASSANVGTNFTGGGAIDFSAASSRADAFSRQQLTVQLHPPDAVTNGAAWSVQGLSGQWPTNAPEAHVELNSGISYTLSFTQVPGYVTPDDFAVNLPTGQDATLVIRYRLLPRMRIAVHEGITVSGDAGASVAVYFKEHLTSNSWSNVLSLTLTDNGTAAIPWHTLEPGYYRSQLSD